MPLAAPTSCRRVASVQGSVALSLSNPAQCGQLAAIAIRSTPETTSAIFCLYHDQCPYVLKYRSIHSSTKDTAAASRKSYIAFSLLSIGHRACVWDAMIAPTPQSWATEIQWLRLGGSTFISPASERRRR